uniref:Uncharacterized protein n=1 Tax=Oryza glaberrima TaxID=4538 RepID=I1R411_ORYGL
CVHSSPTWPPSSSSSPASPSSPSTSTPPHGASSAASLVGATPGSGRNHSHPGWRPTTTPTPIGQGRSARRSESRWSAGGPRWSVPSACQSWRTAACSRHVGTASTPPTWTEPRRGSKEEVRRAHEEKEGQELRHCRNSSRHWSWEMAPSPSSFAAASRPSAGVGKLTGSGWKTQRSGTVPISPNSSGTQPIS